MESCTAPDVVYLIDSLKNPEEVERLRQIYGIGFYLIGIHSAAHRRKRYLVDDKGLSESEAEELISRDEHGGVGYGQRTRDAFHLADFFLSAEDSSDQTKQDLLEVC